MDDIPDIYQIENLEQMRTVADDLRRRIVDSLAARPMTVTQLGDLLGIAPAKAHYHVRELERVGLVKLVETREKGGVLEKYYRTIAKVLTVSPDVLKMVTPDESLALIEGVMRSQMASYLDAVRRTIRTKRFGEDIVAFSTGSLWMTNQEWADAMKRVEEILLPYRATRDVPDEREIAFSLLSHHIESPAETAPAAEEQSAATGASPKPRRNRWIAVGSTTIRAGDLMNALAKGNLLDIFVLGPCAIADDVTPELAERAIGRIRVRGTLSAPDAVREILRHKEADMWKS